MERRMRWRWNAVAWALMAACVAVAAAEDSTTKQTDWAWDVEWPLIYSAALTFSLSSLAGIASLLRAAGKQTLRNTIGVALYNGLLGVSILLSWVYWVDPEHHGPAISVSVLGSLTGLTARDVLVWIVEKIRLSIRENGNGNGKRNHPH